MDALYFKTYDKDLVMQELDLHNDPEVMDGRYFNGNIFENLDFLLVWVGRKADEVDPDTGEVISWLEGEFFNVWVRGQQMMDFFTDLRSAQLLPAPASPDLILFQ